MGCKSARYLAATVGLGIALALSGCTDPAVSDTMKAIDAIGEVTLESAEAIEAANEKYEALDSEKKEQVENYGVLEEANERIAEVKNEAECIDVVESGLMSRFDLEAQDSGTFTGHASNSALGVQGEISGLSQIGELEYGGEFKELLDEYTTSLKNQSEGLAAYPSEPQAYNAKYVKDGLSQQQKCIKAMIDKYGLAVDEAHEDALEAFLETRAAPIVPVGQKVKLNTEKGDVELSLDGFARTKEDISGLKELGIVSESQTVGYLLFTISNISRPIGEDYADYMRFDELATVEDPSGITLDAFDYSGDYPGYSGVGAGVFGVYSDSTVDVGQSKRMCVPYLIDSSTQEVMVAFNNDEQSILVVS